MNDINNNCSALTDYMILLYMSNLKFIKVDFNNQQIWIGSNLKFVDQFAHKVFSFVDQHHCLSKLALIII